MIVLLDQTGVFLLKAEHLMENLGVLVPQDSHLRVHLDILSRQPIDHAFQGLYLFLLLFLSGQDDIHFQLHSIEVVHEFGQTLT